MARYIVDRFEDGDWAVLEDEKGRTLSIPREWLPIDAAEGAVVHTAYEGHGPGLRVVRFETDPAAQRERLMSAAERRENLPRGPKGDISL